MSAGLVDLHSHLVPGVDDGARTLAEALGACAAMVEAGASVLLTTPHLDASLIQREEAFERDQAAVEAAWSGVVEACRTRHPGLVLHLGREVMLDVAIPRLEDPRVRLNGTRYVLVEFPRLLIPQDSEDVLYRLWSAGLVPVLAHVERYAYHGPAEVVLEEWRTAGAVFQVNGPSLVGLYGSRAQALAWDLLARGWVDLLASDYHARGGTSIPEVQAALAEVGGEGQEDLLLRENPGRILRDEPLESVPSLMRHQPGRWSRFLGALRREA